jgi:transposase-like protein
MRLMMQSALERMLNTEMDVHLGRRSLPSVEDRAEADGEVDETPVAPAPAKRAPNRRNGRSRKTVQGDLGELTIATPRNRDGTFEPQLIAKRQRRLAGFDEKILALYAKGMTTRDIQDIVQQLYGVEISPTLISEITADLDAEVTAWRTRPLEAVWSIVYFDGIVVHARNDDGRVTQRTVYVALGMNLQGHKELLGLWLGQAEGAKFWLACLTDLKNRGLQDIFVACINGLSGFAEAIHAAYPQTKVQLCIVHLLRAALRYVSTADSKDVAADLKKIYAAATLVEAEQALENFAQAWDAKYPTIAKMWRAKWTDIITLFDFPPARDPPRDLHHQCHRIREQRDSQIHAQPPDLPQRGVRTRNRVHGHPRGFASLDDAHPQLERGAQPLRHPLRRPHAQVGNSRSPPARHKKIYRLPSSCPCL